MMSHLKAMHENNKFDLNAVELLDKILNVE